MSRIRLLSEQVANQIAAGEVVDRPASVVKELVENALDAGARRVLVEIQAGGRSLIRVTDDGVGMNRDDALLCLERHATSKIQAAEDLAAIETMGFRGEALPSIASVSRMTLTTLEHGAAPEEPATQIIIHGGKMLGVKTAGAPAGTCVEVRQLFYNLPARRKFLRSEETEYSHIHHWLTLAALAHPEVAFTFQRDQRLIWQLPAVDLGEGASGRLAALQERMRALSGVHDQLLAVDFSAIVENPLMTELESESGADEAADTVSPRVESDTARVWGLIGKPGLARSSRQDQHLFVNRRPVENRGLNMALLEGYHTALMKGRYPICCLFLEINPASVDVNIHPAKREVKFRNERGVRRVVAQAVRQALLGFHGVTESSQAAGSEVSSCRMKSPATEPDSAGSETPTQAASTAELPGLVPGTDRIQPASRLPDISPSAGSPFRAQKDAAPAPESRPELSRPLEDPSLIAKTEAPGPAETPAPRSSPVSGVTTASSVPLLNVPLRIVGVVGRLYVVLESDRGMVLMDQHAAHERILFEQMLRRLEEGHVPSQRLLLPETVELSVRDALFLREQMETLNRLGVGLSEFGERTFLLDALPPMVKAVEPRRFVLELIDQLKAAGQEVNSQRLGEHTIAKTVCRHAVKANDPLSGPELEGLLRDLRHCAMPYTCPHGRPTLIEMSYRDLEKKFGRLV